MHGIFRFHGVLELLFFCQLWEKIGNQRLTPILNRFELVRSISEKAGDYAFDPTILFDAVLPDFLPIAKYLISKFRSKIDGQITNKLGITYLQSACLISNYELVRELLKLPTVDVNQYCNSVLSCFQTFNALHFAIFSNDLKIIKILVDHCLINFNLSGKKLQDTFELCKNLFTLSYIVIRSFETIPVDCSPSPIEWKMNFHTLVERRKQQEYKIRSILPFWAWN